MKFSFSTSMFYVSVFVVTEEDNRSNTVQRQINYPFI